MVRGFDLNDADYDLRTPIHLAAAEGREQVVRYFIDNGAAVNPMDRWGGTPLDDARRHGRKRVAKLLEEHGGVSGNTNGETVPTSINGPTVSRDDASPIVELIYAASEGNLPAIRRLPRSRRQFRRRGL